MKKIIISLMVICFLTITFFLFCPPWVEMRRSGNMKILASMPYSVQYSLFNPPSGNSYHVGFCIDTTRLACLLVIPVIALIILAVWLRLRKPKPKKLKATISGKGKINKKVIIALVTIPFIALTIYSYAVTVQYLEYKTCYQRQRQTNQWLGDLLDKQKKEQLPSTFDPDAYLIKKRLTLEEMAARPKKPLTALDKLVAETKARESKQASSTFDPDAYLAERGLAVPKGFVLDKPVHDKQ